MVVAPWSALGGFCVGSRWLFDSYSASMRGATLCSKTLLAARLTKRRGGGGVPLLLRVRSVAALGHGLVRPAPQLPPKPELPLHLRSCPCQGKSTHLWHRRQDQGQL